MVYLFVPIVIYLCISLSDGLRYLITNSSQDAPVLQLFIAFIWGLIWPLRSLNILEGPTDKNPSLKLRRINHG